MTTQDAAVARLEEQVKHLAEDAQEMKAALKQMAEQLADVQLLLTEARGGAKLMKFAFGGVVSFIGLCAAVAGLWKTLHQ
jgi:hypothetical protein